MAMLDEFGPSAAEMREAFDKAAKSGARYMLSVATVLSDPMLVTIFHSTASVASEDEIVPLLKAQNEKKSYGRVNLTGVFDLKRDYEPQKYNGEQQIKTLLSPATQSGLQALNKALKLREDQQEWARRPWYERIFVSKPV